MAAPQSGTWLISGGENAYGGDIINIDAQDNKVFIIFAAGQVPNNTFFWFGFGTLEYNNLSADLTSTKDGSTIHVTGAFNTSMTGTLDFPGVGQRSVFHVKLSDESNPQSMFGFWSFSYLPTNGGPGVAQSYKFSTTMAGSINGSGVAVDATGKFGCELQVSGPAAGYMICMDVNDTSLKTGFVMRRNGDEAGGFYLKNGVGSSIALAQRLVTSDGMTPLFLKSSSTSPTISASAIANFANNYGAMAKEALEKRN